MIKKTLKNFTPVPNASMVIFLNGKENDGKTVTLKILYMLLTGKNYPKDTHLTFMYKGKRIVLCTSGDHWIEIEKNINYLSNVIKTKGDVDVFICAVRSLYDPLDAAEQYSHKINENKYDAKYVIWKKKIDPKENGDDSKDERPKFGSSTISGHKTSKYEASCLQTMVNDFIDSNKLYHI